MGQRHARIGLLLATTSVAALLAAAPTPASAAPCASNTLGPGLAAGCTNTAAVASFSVTNALVIGDVGNTGTISPGGLTVTSSIIIGSIFNTGTIAGGIVIDGGSLITSANTGINVSNTPTFSGGISNAGTIIGNTGILVDSVVAFSGGISNSGTITAGTSGNGIFVGNVQAFSGGISNSGTITVAGTSGNGITVQSVQAFSGGITNSGTITAGSAGISVQNVGVFSGDIVNTGTITASVGIDICGCVTSFAGNIINSGTINASRTGISVGSIPIFQGGITNTGTITAAPFSGIGIFVLGVSAFSGGIVNSGTIAAGVGIFVLGVESFAGGILNSGSISGGNGIGVGSISAFSGGIANAGSITAAVTAIRLNVISTFAGGITNSGAITTSFGVGIAVQAVDNFFGGITNTGSISAGGAGILVTACGCVGTSTFAGGIFNSGTISAGSTAGIFVSGVSTFLGGITNTGVISGPTGILITPDVTGISIFNSGTITGNGGTAIQFGGGTNTLTLGPGSVINGNVIGAGSDAFQLGGSSGSGTFDVSTIGPQYQGFGTFAKIDTSTWTLTGTNNAALPWTVLGGTLNVAAGAALPNSPFTVQGGTFAVNGTVGAVTLNGGTLMGNGTLAALFANGGIVAPGNSIGQLNVNGPVTFAAGTTYQVEANAAGQSDRILVTGTATLSGGTVQAILAPGAYGLTTTFTILTANGGRFGAFSSVTDNLPFLIPTLSYDANNAYLTLTRDTLFFQNQAGTRNQRAVASALDTFPTDNPLFLAAANLRGGATRQALDLLSGEIHASVHSVMLDDSLYLRQAVLGRLRQASFQQGPLSALGAGGPLAYAAPDETETTALAYAAKGRTTARSKARPFPIKAPRDVAPAAGPERTWWAQGVGAWGKINGDGNAADVSRNLGGFFTGFDQRFGEWRVGVAGGYTNSSVSVSARASSANIEAAHLAGYAGTSFGAWNLRTGAAVSFDQVSTSRSIVFPGFSDSASARYHGTTGQVFGEAGYGMALGAVAVEPFAGLAYVHIGSTSFTETGGLAALAGSGNKNDIGYSTLGARAATHVPLANGMLLTPRASLAWQHAFGDVTPTAALAFRSAGIPFTIAGAPIARDAALVDAGFDLNVGWQATVGLAYVGVLASTAHDHSVKGNFSWKF